MPPAPNGPAAGQLTLFQAYFVLLQGTERFPPLIWIPVFKSRRLRVVRIPVLRAAVVIFVSSHMKRVIEALDRGHRLRLATEDSGQADWKAMHEQAESMKAGLPGVAFSRWLLAMIAFLIVFLSSRILPHEDLALTSKMIVTALTLNPEKFAELAAEPNAGLAILRLLFWVVALFIALVPIVVYHFRFKRMLFNFPAPLPSAAIKRVTVLDIWKEKLTSAQSIYAVEDGLFFSLDQCAPSEIAFDLLATIIAFGFYSLGPGVFVGVMGAQVYSKNSGAGWQLFFIAAFNLAVGLTNVYMAVQEIKRRRTISNRAKDL